MPPSRRLSTSTGSAPSGPRPRGLEDEVAVVEAQQLEHQLVRSPTRSSVLTAPSTTLAVDPDSSPTPRLPLRLSRPVLPVPATSRRTSSRAKVSMVPCSATGDASARNMQVTARTVPLLDGLFVGTSGAAGGAFFSRGVNPAGRATASRPWPPTGARHAGPAARRPARPGARACGAPFVAVAPRARPRAAAGSPGAVDEVDHDLSRRAEPRRSTGSSLPVVGAHAHRGGVDHQVGGGDGVGGGRADPTGGARQGDGGLRRARRVRLTTTTSAAPARGQRQDHRPRRAAGADHHAPAPAGSKPSRRAGRRRSPAPSVLSPTSSSPSGTTQLTAPRAAASSLRRSTAAATAVLCGIVTDSPRGRARAWRRARRRPALGDLEGHVDPVEAERRRRRRCGWPATASGGPGRRSPRPDAVAPVEAGRLSRRPGPAGVLFGAGSELVVAVGEEVVPVGVGRARSRASHPSAGLQRRLERARPGERRSASAAGPVQRGCCRASRSRGRDCGRASRCCSPRA